MKTETALIEEMYATLKLIGMKRLITGIKRLRSVQEDQEPDIVFITDMVCSEYGIDFVTVTDNKTTHPDESVIYTRAFIVYYLRTVFCLPWNDLVVLLKRTQNHLYTCARIISDLKPNLSSDKRHLGYKSNFDQQIKQYCKKNKKLTNGKGN